MPWSTPRNVDRGRARNSATTAASTRMVAGEPSIAAPVRPPPSAAARASAGAAIRPRTAPARRPHALRSRAKRPAPTAVAEEDRASADRARCVLALHGRRSHDAADLDLRMALYRRGRAPRSEPGLRGIGWGERTIPCRRAGARLGCSAGRCVEGARRYERLRRCNAGGARRGCRRCHCRIVHERRSVLGLDAVL